MWWDAKLCRWVWGPPTTQTTWLLITHISALFPHSVLFHIILRINIISLNRLIGSCQTEMRCKSRSSAFTVRCDVNVYVMLFKSTPCFQWLNWNDMGNVPEFPIRTSAKTPSILNKVRGFLQTLKINAANLRPSQYHSFSGSSSSLCTSNFKIQRFICRDRSWG